MWVSSRSCGAKGRVSNEATSEIGRRQADLERLDKLLTRNDLDGLYSLLEGELLGKDRRRADDLEGEERGGGARAVGVHADALADLFDHARKKSADIRGGGRGQQDDKRTRDSESALERREAREPKSEAVYRLPSFLTPKRVPGSTIVLYESCVRGK